MRKFLLTLVFLGLIGGIVAVVVMLDPTLPGDAPDAAPPGTPTAASGTSYALDASKDVWPPLDGTTPNTAGSGDLFARNYYVILDGSDSMNGYDCSGSVSKIEAARVALTSFAASVPRDANLGLAAFNGNGIGELLPLGRDNRAQFVSAVKSLAASGGTPLSLAFEGAYGRLLEQAKQQLGYGEYHLVTVTDGEASVGYDPTTVVNRILADSPLVLHTIGFCISDNHSLNQPGRTYYRPANDVQALQHGLDEVLAEAPAFSVTEFGE